jgi:hypothetical protein
MRSKTHSFLSNFLGYAVHLEHDASGLNDCYPVLRGTLTGTHSGLSRLLGDGLIGEDLDPNVTATADVTGHSDTGSLDLVGGDPSRLKSYETVCTVRQLVTAGSLTGKATALYATELNSLRH